MIVARPAAWINLRFGLRPLVWGGVLALAALALDFVPLFDLLGFDFSFVVGLGAAFAAADVGHGAVTAARRAHQRVSLWALVSSAVAAGLALLAAPLLLSLANAWRVRNCNLPVGLAFYALLPVASVLVAAPAGVLAALLVRGPRLGRLLALMLPAASIAWAMLRLYLDPPVFALDPFGGYFPGPIYDEGLRPSARLLWFRLANLTWIATALVLAGCLSRGGQPDEAGPPTLAWRPFPSRLTLARWLGAALALLLGSALWFGFRAELGFHLTQSRSGPRVVAADAEPAFCDVERSGCRHARRDPARARRSGVPLPSVARHLRQRAAHADHRLSFLLGAGKEGSGRRRRHAFRQALAARDLRAGRALSRILSCAMSWPMSLPPGLAIRFSGCRWPGACGGRCRFRTWASA